MNGYRRMNSVWAGLIALAVATPAVGEDLAAAAKKPPKDPEAALALGRSLRRAGMFDEGVRVLRGAALRAQGELSVAARYEAARTLIAANRQKDALRECQGIKARSKVRWETCFAEAQLLWKRASLALPAAERALAESPDNYDALVAKGRAQRMLGKNAESEAAFKAAIVKDGSRFEAPMFYSELLSGLGRGTESVAALRKAHAAAPDEPEPTKLLLDALSIRPKYGPAQARLGDVHLELGKVAEAETAFRAAIAINAKVADWHAGLARALVAKNDWDEALKASAVALKLVGNHGLAMLAEADATAGKGEIDLAIEAYEKAASFTRDSPNPLVHAARACLRQNRPTTARAFADRATQSFEAFAPAWLVLGDVAVATKDKGAAKQAYQKALSAPRGSIDKAEVKKKLAAIK